MLHQRPYPVLILLLLWTTVPLHAQQQPVANIVQLNQAVGMETLAAELETRRVVFAGETHDRYDHHLNQLEIIKQLYRLDPNLAIGVEYFPRRVQSSLDDYVAGRIDEDEFLRSSGYFESWGYDYRLYAPIFRYAREQEIPLVALNVPSALASAVARRGIDGVPKDLQEYLPKEIDRSDTAYRDRLRQVYQAHGNEQPAGFDHFVEAQLVWDEGMAETAAAYLNMHPNTRLVVLAGSGHLEYGSGIPKRVARRTKATYAIVLDNDDDVEPSMADYIIFSKEEKLPPAGILGVRLQDAGGECRISALLPGAALGLREDDVILEIDGRAIRKTSDVKVALWNKKPGERLGIRVRRKRHFRSPVEDSFEIELRAPPASTADPR